MAHADRCPLFSLACCDAPISEPASLYDLRMHICLIIRPAELQIRETSYPLETVKTVEHSNSQRKVRGKPEKTERGIEEGNKEAKKNSGKAEWQSRRKRGEQRWNLYQIGELPFFLIFDNFLNMIIMSEIIWTIRTAYIKIFHTHNILIFYGRQICLVQSFPK